jgi:hypothetical protein
MPEGLKDSCANGWLLDKAHSSRIGDVHLHSVIGPFYAGTTDRDPRLQGLRFARMYPLLNPHDRVLQATPRNFGPTSRDWYGNSFQVAPFERRILPLLDVRGRYQAGLSICVIEARKGRAA